MIHFPLPGLCKFHHMQGGMICLEGFMLFSLLLSMSTALLRKYVDPGTTQRNGNKSF